jgi:hypothetical protein
VTVAWSKKRRPHALKTRFSICSIEIGVGRFAGGVKGGAS